MPRSKLGPRLYLDPKRREWIIRDGNTFKRTGAGEADHERALYALTRHIRVAQSGRTIYFLTCLHDDYPVKIGRALNLNDRMANLRTALPYQLVLLASFAGDSTDEAKLHKMFVHLRLQGEWFKRTPELMDFIASLGTFEALPDSDIKAPEFAVSRALALM